VLELELETIQLMLADQFFLAEFSGRACALVGESFFSAST